MDTIEQKINDYGWLKYDKTVSGDLEYDEILKLVKSVTMVRGPVWQDNTELQKSEIEIIVNYIFTTCDFPYKALAAIINLRNDYTGLLTNVDINELESYPSATEIYVYIGSKKLEHGDIGVRSDMPDDFRNETGGDAAW